MQNKICISLLFLLIATLFSCSMEERAALKYQNELPKTTILLSANPKLFITNSKIVIPENISDQQYEKLYQQSMDSSDFIANIDVYAFWDNCKSMIEKNIINSEFKYLPSDSITIFIDNDRPKFIFDIKQVEIEEYFVEYVDTYYSSNDDYYYFDENSTENINAKDFYAEIKNYEVEETNSNYFEDNISSSTTKRQSKIQIYKPINAVAINYWIEVNSYLKNAGHKRELIYITKTMEDAVTNTRDLSFDDLLYISSYNNFENLYYKIDSVDIDKIWLKSAEWSKEITDILNSYTINRVIDDKINNVTDAKKRKRHWVLNINTGRILPTDKSEYKIIERFEEY